jgi:hypothetical protein
VIPNIKTSTESMTEKVWFVDFVTEYGYGHFVPIHVTLERCAELLNANYVAVVDQNCPPSIGTEKWLRVLHNSRNLDLHYLTQFAKQRQLYRALQEIQTQIRSFSELSIRIRSLIKNIRNDANSIVIYLDFATPLQIIAIWFSVASLLHTRNKTIVWIHFHQPGSWQETKIGRIARYLFNIFHVHIWKTTFTNEIAAENRKYGWNLDVLPLPLNPALNAVSNHKLIDKLNGVSEKPARLICWGLITRPEQGLDKLQNMIAHKSSNNLPKKFIKCFVREGVNILESDNINLVRVPYGSKDYHLQFNECDVVLLPYIADSFRSKMSMVFIEAVAMCKIPIVSDGTVMASELRRFKLDELIMDFDNEFSWIVINQIRESISIRERLKVMAECYAREHDTFAYAESLYKNLKQGNPNMALTEPKRP